MGTVVQFGPSGGRIKSKLLFAIYFEDAIQKCSYHHDRTPKRKLVSVDSVVWRASGRAPRPIFGSKFYFFLRYTHITPLIGLRRTQPNGIISPPYPEVTLD